MTGGLSRRRFLAVAGGIGAAGAVGLTAPAVLLRGGGTTSELLRSEAPLPTPFARPLVVPPVLAPTSTAGGVDRYDVVQQVRRLRILDGLDTEAWTYAGSFPGPTVVGESGRPVVVTHHNRLPVPSVVHLHGAHTTSESDGYATDLVLPPDWQEPDHAGHAGHGMEDPRAVVTRASRRYEYGHEQPAATLWYHDHRMDFTGPAIYRGLAGFHLVHDDAERAAGLPSGERDLPLMITDRAFEADGSFRYPSVDPSLTGPPGVRADFVEGVVGDVVLVNGVPWPEHEVDRARYRLRMLNASNARRYDLALDPPPPGGGGLVQVGADQGLLDAPVVHDHLPIGPAERYEVVVDFARYEPGAEVRLVNLADRGTPHQVLRFRVGPTTVDDSSPVEALRLPQAPALRREDAVAVRDLSFRSGRHEMADGGHGWLIDAEAFDPARTDVTVRRGTVEVWRFVADVHHPVHLHLVGFQVLSRGGTAPAAHDAGVKDTIDLRPGESAEVIARFDGSPGRYMFHCHNAEHEDLGMMANLELV